MIERFTDCIRDPRGAWAEIERLRAALKEIEEIGVEGDAPMSYGTLRGMYRVAHEALKGEEAEHGV